MPHVGDRCIEVGAMMLKHLHDRCGVWDLPGPIREEMQRRTSAALLIADYARGEVRLGRQQAGEPFDIALLECRCELDGERVVASQVAAGWGHRACRATPCGLEK